MGKQNKTILTGWLLMQLKKKFMVLKLPLMEKTQEFIKLVKMETELWNDDRKVQGNVSNFEIIPQGLAVVSDKNDGGSSSVFATKNESEIAFLSAATGEDVMG